MGKIAGEPIDIGRPIYLGNDGKVYVAAGSSDLDNLLASQQAIIDAWVTSWRAEQKKRIDEFWARKSAQLVK